MAGLFALTVGQSRSWAEFDPPRVTDTITPHDTGAEPNSALQETLFSIDEGLEFGIKKGDRLNVYREKPVSSSAPQPARMFIGRMLITGSKSGVSVGRFEPNDETISAMEGDIVLPRFVIDASILCIVEGRRPPERRSAEAVAKQKGKIANALDALESDAAGLDAPVTIGAIALGCALGYLDFRFPDEDWRAGRPALAAWYREFAARPSMQQSIPREAGAR